jgi:hypothetical protein
MLMLKGNRDGDVFGCGHVDGYGFMRNKFFLFWR